MAEAVAAEGAPAALPPVIMFPSFTMNILHGTDPVSGAAITNLVVTSGNGALQVTLPLDPISRAALVRELQRGMIQGNGGQPSDTTPPGE